jgi:hypothetical protein
VWGRKVTHGWILLTSNPEREFKPLGKAFELAEP